MTAPAEAQPRIDVEGGWGLSDAAIDAWAALLLDLVERDAAVTPAGSSSER